MRDARRVDTSVPVARQHVCVDVGEEGEEMGAARSTGATIVVGAGALGCWASWHLCRNGRAVTLIEAADAPASQSTAGAAGFVAAWSAIHVGPWDSIEWDMQRYGIERYRALARDTTADIGLQQCGIAYIYRRPEAWADAQARIARARRLGTNLEVLDGARAATLLPQIAFGRVAGIVYDPDAVRVRAGDAIQALARLLEQQGVRCEFATAVSGFVREGGRIVGVETNRGPFHGDHTVLTAGAWSRPLLDHLGVYCPAEPLVETRYVTRPLPGIAEGMPLLIFADCHGFYIRSERGGLLIGGGDQTPMPADRRVDAHNPPPIDRLPSAQAFRIRELIREVEDIMPVLAQGEVGEIRSGLPTFTSDQRFILDTVPGYPGLSVAAGCQEAGVTHGPALGRMLAELVTTGATHWNRDSFRLARFET